MTKNRLYTEGNTFSFGIKETKISGLYQSFIIFTDGVIETYKNIMCKEKIDDSIALTFSAGIIQIFKNSILKIKTILNLTINKLIYG